MVNLSMVTSTATWTKALTMGALLLAGMILENYLSGAVGDKMPDVVSGYGSLVMGIVTAIVLGIVVGMVKRDYGVTAFTLMVAFSIAREFRGAVSGALPAGE